jgi:hypothetical protein
MDAVLQFVLTVCLTIIVGWVGWLHKKVHILEDIVKRVIVLEETAIGEKKDVVELAKQVKDIEANAHEREVRLALIERAVAEMAPIIPKLTEAVIRITTLIDAKEKR